MVDVEAFHLVFMVQDGVEKVFSTRRAGVSLPGEFVSNEVEKLRALKSVFESYDYRAYARFNHEGLWECSSAQLYLPSSDWYKVFSIELNCDGRPTREFSVGDLLAGVAESESEPALLPVRPNYIVVTKQNLMILLNCIVQYGRIARKDLSSSAGTQIEAVVLDLFNGTRKTEQVLVDYRFDESANQMPVIGELVRVCAGKQLDDGNDADFVILNQFCNYSSLINFENGNVNGIILYTLPGSSCERKAFIKFNVKDFVDSVCVFKNGPEETSYGFRIKEFIDA